MIDPQFFKIVAFLAILMPFTECGVPPVIKEHPKSITTRKNDPATLNCAVSEGSLIRWYRNGEPIEDKTRSHRYIILDGSLFFLRVTDGKKESDSGVYWCEAYNDYGVARSRNATLSVATIDNVFQLEPEPIVQGRRGEKLVLPCRPPLGTPLPSLRWKHDGQQMTNTSRVFTSSSGDLIFEQVSEKDAGTYVCLAQNMAGVKESSVSTLKVIYKPWFEEGPQNLTAIAGASVEFFCKVKGNPPPKISWRRLDGKMPLGRTQVSTTHTLRIQGISASDSGTYICEAKNDAGSSSAQGILSVVAAPIVEQKPSNALALIGEEAVLKCLITGDPKPIIIWRLPFQDHSSHLLAGGSNSKISVAEDGSQLNVLDLQLSDTGLYQCWGVSTGGGVSSLAEIVVVEALPPPLIGVRPHDLYVSVGSSVTFPCEVVSEMAEPTVTWHFQRASHLPSRKIISKGSVTILATGALILKRVTENDAGIYKCKVSSKSGSVEAEALLKIENGSNEYLHRPISVPAPPTKPKIMAFNSTSVRLSWLPNSRRGPSVESLKYTVEYWRAPWQEWRVALTEVSEEYCLVTDLVSNVAYIFLVRAVDDNGESFPSPWSDIVYTSKPDDPNLTLEGERQARRRLNKPSVSLSSVRIMTADTVILSWKILEGSEMELDGVIIYTISEDTIHTSTVLGEASSSYVRDLQPNRQYTFFLVPFWRTIQGVPSNSRSITTPEEAPRLSPQGLNIEIYESGIVLLRWDPLTPDEARGNVIGYHVSFAHNGSSFVEETPTPWLEAKKLLPGKLYIVKVAAVTSAGAGPWSVPEPITISDVPGSSQQEINKSGTDVPSVLYAPPHPAWLLYLLVPVIILLIVGILLYLKKFRRKSSPASLEQNSGTNIYPDSSIYSPHPQHVNMYSEQKLWRPADSDKDSSISSARLLRPEHLVNEYAEPRIHRLNDTAEPYATTALLAPSTPRIGRTPPSWRHGRCADENGIQVNWAAILPPPPACPPPPNLPPHEGESCSSATTSSESSDRRCYSPPSQYDNTAGSEQYEHPCDATSEHTYAAYSPIPAEVPNADSFHTFCTLQGVPMRRVRLDCHPTCSEPPKSNTH